MTKYTVGQKEINKYYLIGLHQLIKSYILIRVVNLTIININNHIDCTIFQSVEI